VLLPADADSTVTRDSPLLIALSLDLSLADEGCLMVATGWRHRQEACQAAACTRSWLNGRPLLLVTDQPHSGELHMFDYVALHPCPVGSYRDKIAPLACLPFERCLFLDTDAVLIQPIDDLFALLQVFDVMGCHAPVRFHRWRDPAVPEGFCELNSGVLGLRRGNATRDMIGRWLTCYDQINIDVDQASLRSALWAGVQQGLRLWVLPPEYNLRTTKPWLIGRGLPVKVVHGRLPQRLREPLLRYLNTDVDRFRSSVAVDTKPNEWARGVWSLARLLAWLRRRVGR
jgi:hypothetical protein